MSRPKDCGRSPRAARRSSGSCASVASAAATAALATSKGKDYDVTTGELRERWRKGAAELGLDRTAVRELVERPHEPAAPAEVLLDDLTRHAATLDRHDVVQAVAAAYGNGVRRGEGSMPTISTALKTGQSALF